MAKRKKETAAKTEKADDGKLRTEIKLINASITLALKQINTLNEKVAVLEKKLSETKTRSSGFYGS